MDRSAAQATLLARVQAAFEPYVKSKAEVARIRKLLADNPCDLANDVPLWSSSLEDSLVSNGGLPDPLLSDVQKRYLRSLETNRDIFKQYNETSSVEIRDVARDRPESDVVGASQSPPLATFVDLIRARQAQEKARIIQEHLRTLRDTLATSDHRLKEVVRRPETSSLTGILGEVQKSTLSAKARWRKEHLAFLGSRSACEDELASKSWDAEALSNAKLHALNATHAALIAWIEDGLSNTNESFEISDNTDSSVRSEERTPFHIESVQAVYEEYNTTRDRLFKRVAASTSLPPIRRSSLNEEKEQSVQQVVDGRAVDRLLLAKQLRAISKEQKLVLQQRSHLTNSANRQHKKTVGVLDRLKQESHLIPEAASQRSTKESNAIHPETLASSRDAKETPTTLLGRVAAWTSAEQSAGWVTNGFVLDHLENGEHAMNEAHQSIAHISRLIGQDVSDIKADDIWAGLNGHLGMID